MPAPTRLSALALAGLLASASGCVAPPSASEMWTSYEQAGASEADRAVYARAQREEAESHAFWGWIGTATAGAGTVSLAALTANNHALDRRDHWDGPWEATLSLTLVSAAVTAFGAWWSWSEGNSADEWAAIEQKLAHALPKESPPPAEKPAAKPAEKPAAKPAEKPAAKPAEKPAAKPAEKPAAKPAEKPAEKPADKPGESGR